jgi:hypothetical protein
MDNVILYNRIDFMGLEHLGKYKITLGPSIAITLLLWGSLLLLGCLFLIIAASLATALLDRLTLRLLLSPHLTSPSICWFLVHCSNRCWSLTS